MWDPHRYAIGSIPIRPPIDPTTRAKIFGCGSRFVCDNSQFRGCNNAGMSEQERLLDRRGFLGVCSIAGLGQTLLPGALFTLATQARAQSSPIMGGGDVKASTDTLAKITPEMIDAAAVIAGISVTDEQKKMMLEGLEQLRKSYTAIRELKMPNSVAPAFVFDPVPGDMVLDTAKKPMKMSAAPDVKALAAVASAGLNEDSDTLAFASVR